MPNKCPYCFRPEGTWTNDPILVINGAKYDWLNDTTLQEITDINQRFYRGLINICEEHLIELQTNRRALEEEILLVGERTNFSPVNDTGFFQITGQHIKELRESTEKILTELGVTKTTYFNYDEEGNHIVSPAGDKLDWTDLVSTDAEWNKFQVQNIHIEDLRHYIPTFPLWKETWDTARILPSDPYSIVSYYLSIDSSLSKFHDYVDYKARIYADHMWTNENTYGLYPIHLGLGGTGAAATGEGTSSLNFIIDGTNKILHEDCYFYNIDNSLHLDSNAILTADGRFITTLVSPGFACDENLHFSIKNLSYSYSASEGSIVILEDPYYYYGWHYTANELNAAIAANYLGGYISFRVYFQHPSGEFYINFYKVAGKNVLSPTNGLLWTPDGNNGMYLYDAVLLKYGYVSPTVFKNSWKVTKVTFGFEMKTGTLWNGYTEGDIFYVKGYTTNASLSFSYIVNDLKLIIVSR